MAGRIAQKLAELDLTLPELPGPFGAYTGFVQSGSLVYVSGQISKDGDTLLTGRLGDDVDVAFGQRAARVCALSLLAQVNAACGGDLDRVTRVVKLGGFVNAAPGFDQHPQVINGASELMLAVFGDAGVHARAAVGCSSLPMNVAVEVEGVFEIA